MLWLKFFMREGKGWEDCYLELKKRDLIQPCHRQPIRNYVLGLPHYTRRIGI